MAITSSYTRLVIQQGTSFGATFSILNEDGTTFSNLSDWEATFEIFDANGVSLYKWSSATSANVDTGLWTRLGEVIPGDDTTDFAYNGYVELPKEITSAMSDWGIGHFDFDFIDPFGHVQLRYHDEIVLEEGTTHV